MAFKIGRAAEFVLFIEAYDIGYRVRASLFCRVLQLPAFKDQRCIDTAKGKIVGHDVFGVQ